jgi:hypothetical protein
MKKVKFPKWHHSPTLESYFLIKKPWSKIVGIDVLYNLTDVSPPPPPAPSLSKPVAERLERVMGDQLTSRTDNTREYWMIHKESVFSPANDLAPPPPPTATLPSSLFLSLPGCRRSSLLIREGWGWWRSQIIRPRESLLLYKLFYTLLTMFPDCLLLGRVTENLLSRQTTTGNFF